MSDPANTMHCAMWGDRHSHMVLRVNAEHWREPDEGQARRALALDLSAAGAEIHSLQAEIHMHKTQWWPDIEKLREAERIVGLRPTYGDSRRLPEVLAALVEKSKAVDECRAENARLRDQLGRIAAILNAHHNGDDGEISPGQSKTQALAAIADVLGPPWPRSLKHNQGGPK